MEKQDKKPKDKEENPEEEDLDLEELVREIEKLKKLDKQEIEQFKSRRKIETKSSDIGEEGLGNLQEILKNFLEEDSLENLLGKEILKEKHNLSSVNYDSKSREEGNGKSSGQNLYQASSKENNAYIPPNRRETGIENRRENAIYQENLEINTENVAWNPKTHFGRNEEIHFRDINNNEIRDNLQNGLKGQRSFSAETGDGFSTMQNHSNKDTYQPNN